MTASGRWVIVVAAVAIAAAVAAAIVVLGPSPGAPPDAGAGTTRPTTTSDPVTSADPGQAGTPSAAASPATDHGTDPSAVPDPTRPAASDAATAPAPTPTPAPVPDDAQPGYRDPEPEGALLGCAHGPADADAAEVRREAIDDVDGDGAADTAIVTFSPDGERNLHLETAAGTSTPYSFTSPSPAFAVGSADVDGQGHAELFVGIRMHWFLLTINGCDLVAVTNVQGRPYTFIVGDPDGDEVIDGLGCVDVDGDDVPELVGTRATREADVYRVSRTVVEVTGDQARNGPTDVVTVDADDTSAVATLDTATCGQVSLEQASFG